MYEYLACSVCVPVRAGVQCVPVRAGLQCVRARACWRAGSSECIAAPGAEAHMVVAAGLSSPFLFFIQVAGVDTVRYLVKNKGVIS